MTTDIIFDSIQIKLGEYTMSVNGEKLVALHNLHAEIHMLLGHYFTGFFSTEENRPDTIFAHWAFVVGLLFRFNE